MCSRVCVLVSFDLHIRALVLMVCARAWGHMRVHARVARRILSTFILLATAAPGDPMRGCKQE